jgi:hypothetical protein
MLVEKYPNYPVSSGGAICRSQSAPMGLTTRFRPRFVRQACPPEGRFGPQAGLPAEGRFGPQAGLPAEGRFGPQAGLPAEGRFGPQAGLNDCFVMPFCQ